MQRLITRNLLLPLFAAILCVGAISTPALAQSGNAPHESALALQLKIRKIVAQLNEIEKKAIVNDAALQAMRKNFYEDMVSFMHKKGFKPEADKKELVAIRKKVLGGKLSKSEKAAEIKKFQAVRARLQKAQLEALKDKSLQHESQELGQATMASMLKQDPNTQKLLKQLKEAGKKLQSMRKAEASKSAKH